MSEKQPSWTFLSNHSHVLVCLALDAGVRTRDIAARVGITERAVQRLVSELEEAGAISKTRDGRRNRYAVHREFRLRHTLESHRTVGDLLDLLLSQEEA